MKLITVLTEKPTGLKGLSETHTVCVINPLYVAQLLPLLQKQRHTGGTRISFVGGMTALNVLTDIENTAHIIENALNSPDTVQGERTFSPQLRMHTDD